MLLRKDILQREQDIKLWISEHRSMAWMCSQLVCKPLTLKNAFKELGISYTGNQGNKGYKIQPYVPASEYLGTNKQISGSKLKEKLIKEGIKKQQCELCGETLWLGKHIPLELHHKDGNHYNNSLDNLQILCPNCHALQENNSGKNIKTFKAKKEKRHRDIIIKEKQKLNRPRKRRLKHTLSEEINLKVAGKVDSLGRINDNIITDSEWENRKSIIINSGVDLMSFGWQAKVSFITGLTRKQIQLTINHYRNLFDSISYKRK